MAKPYVPYEGPIVTREQSKALGQTRFFTGKPCKHGHLSQRTTCNGGCIQCNAITTLAMYFSESEEKRAKRRARGVAFGEAHRKERRAYGREYAIANKAKYRARQIANRELLNAQARAARERNPELANARATRYARTPKGKLNGAVGAMRRYARLLGAEGTYNAEDVRRIGGLQKWKCHWCGKPTKQSFHVDHIIPLAKGGSNWPSNLCIACPPCNRRKNATDPLEFARRLGRLV